MQFNQQLKHVQIAIRQRGFTTIPVTGKLLHTVGLTEKGWPEIFITGPIHDLIKSNFILWTVHMWREQNKPVLGEIADFFTAPDDQGQTVSRSIKLVSISPEQSGITKSPFMSALYPQSQYSAVQLLWPDDKGCFPDDQKYSTDPSLQQDRFQPLQ